MTGKTAASGLPRDDASASANADKSHVPQAENNPAMLVSQDGLQRAAALVRARLRDMPSAPVVTLRALVAELKPDLAEARRKGLSWRSIAIAFEEVGLKAPPETVRIYVVHATPTRAARAAKRTRPRVPDAPAATTSAPSASPTASSRATSPPVSRRSDGALIAPRVK